MIRREAFEASLRNLSSIGFKILVDLFASSPRPLRVKELPFEFRNRHSGESKFDAMIAIEYVMLLADKVVGHIVPIRFLSFLAVGGVGVFIHLAVLWAGLYLLLLPFAAAQATATGVAMVGNFVLNNAVTYRDRRLTGWKFVYGLVSFCLICGIGAIANVGVATVLFEDHATWWAAGLIGAAMSAVWNYAMTSALTWRNVSG